MNINVESHFSKIPRADIQRSVFDRSHSLKTSFNVGDLVPICCEEILPGDTVKMTTSKVIRLQTLLTPMMDNIYAEVFWFYTPFRILWKHYREFCGENSESAWVPSTTYTEPKIASPSGGFAPGTIADYLGFPVNVEWSEDDELAGSALPFRAYAHICNEWFRDANLKDPLLIPDGDAYQVGTNGDNYIEDVANGGKPFKVAKWHDRYTSCLPAPQYGEAAGISISGEVNLPVIATADHTNGSLTPLHYRTVGGTSSSTGYVNVSAVRKYDPNASTNLSVNALASTGNNSQGIAPDNLFATVPDGAFSFDVNQMRLAFATQRYLEKMAYGGGNRYTTMLRVLFGVTAPDASLQRPEYLGGNRVPLNVSEVTNNAQTENEYLGDLGGMSSTADRHYDFIKSFSEAGYLIGCVCLRYKHSYTQGMPRKFTRTNFLDYYQPTFANLGNMPVYSAELYAKGNLADGKSKIFGYQEAWSEYRFSEDRCSGLMRPDVPESLASWHLADNYSETPTLSSEWIDEDKTNVDRVLAVSSEISDQAFADFYFEFVHTRPMPMYSIPGLIDHF